MDILTILVVGTLNIVCFFIGAKVGQTVSKGKEIEIVTPVEYIKRVQQENIDRREQELEQKRLDTILHNIENYDGTPNGQEDVPRW